MMRATWKRFGSVAWAGLGLGLIAPGLAEAQLFPNQNVKRERQPCASEPPFYATVRQNYFGYYPTCWSRFPAGWGCPCPNPELPNKVAAFQERKRDDPPPFVPDNGLDPLMEGDDLGPLPDGRKGEERGMPPVPNAGRSPFNSDPSAPDPAPEGAPNPGGNLPPETRRGPNPGASTAPKPPTTSVSPPVPTTTGLLEMPRMLPPVAATTPSASTLDLGTITAAPEATLTSTGSVDRPSLGPLPAPSLPEASIPPGPEMGIDPTLLARSQPTGPAVAGTPAQAPQRRSVLGGLFGSAKRRR